MDSMLLNLIFTIAEATTADAYLQAQDRAVPVGEASYAELIEIVRADPDAPVRIAALSLVLLLDHTDAESVFRERMDQDPDENVRAFANHFLFRATVAQTALSSQRMSAEQFQAYKIAARRLYAERMFSAEPSDEGSTR
jgi:hypothetical protein